MIKLTCSFLKKDTKVSKGQSTNFKSWLLILVTYLAEIIYIYICFPRFSFTDFNRHPFKTWEFWKGDCWNLESLASFSKMTMLITFINCLPLWNSLGGLKLTVECVKSDLCFCTAHWVKNWTLLRKDAIIGKCFHVNKLKLRITLTKVSLHFSIT